MTGGYAAGGSRQTPTELRIKKDDKVLEIDFDDGVSFRIAPAEHVTEAMWWG